MHLKASPFLHLLSLDDNYFAFYNSLNLDVAFVKKEFVEKSRIGSRFLHYDNESKKIIHSLKKIKLLIAESTDGLEDYYFYRKALEEPSINILYLLLTDACNLRCKYCYFLSNMNKEYKYSFMSEKTAVNAIDLFARCIKKSISAGYKDQQIVIYGGEPTLNKKTLITALLYILNAKKRGLLPKHVSITINTNGVLIDKEILNIVKKTDAVLAISIDGPPDVHNNMRVFPNGKPSFEQVIKNYNLAKAKGIKTGLCCTVDSHNLGKLTDTVTWLSEKLDVKGMGFNILIENTNKSTSNENNDYSSIVAEELINCFKIARKKGIYEDRMMRRVKNFIDKTPVLSDCGGCGLQIVVSPDEKIGVCQAYTGEKKYFVSESFDTFEPEKHPYWQEWRKRSPLLMKECMSCIALGNCGGGCPYNADKRNGSIWTLDDSFCNHAKTSVEFLIRDLWEQLYKRTDA